MADEQQQQQGAISTESTELAESEWPPWAKRFLRAYADTGNVRAACQACHIHRTTPYVLRKNSAAFGAAWDQAHEDACDLLEAEARRRALTTSDNLLRFLLASHRPAVYRETQRHEHTGRDGEPIEMHSQVEVVRDAAAAFDARVTAWLEKAALAEARTAGETAALPEEEDGA